MPANAPQIDFDVIKQTANNMHDTILSGASEWGAPGWLAEFVATLLGGLVAIPVSFFLVAAQVVVAIGSWAAASFLEIIDAAKAENQDGLNTVLAESINEMLGTSLDAGDLNAGSGSGATMEANQNIGDAILSLFEQSFGATGPVDADQGAANARKFAGWAVSFATQQGFMSILTEACSLGFLKEFHELPDAVRQGLGLGRLQRLALQPLIQMAIQKPYERYCNNRFRPTQLAEAQLVKALHSGDMDEGDVKAALAELGYADDKIDFILTDFAAKLALSEQLILLNNGDIQEQDVINNLTLTGLPEDQAKLQLKAAQENEAKSEYTSMLSAIGTAYIAGHIDQDTYNNLLSNLPLGDAQLEAFRARIGFEQETPRKSLSFSDVEAAIVDGVVDFGYLDKWFAQEGYDSDAQSILSFKVLKAITKTTEKQAYAKYRAAVLRKAGKDVPPWITDAETAT